MSRERCIVYCHCAEANVIPPDARRKVLAGLIASGVAFEAVPDLCELSARRDPLMEQIAAAGEVRIAACFPRAVRSLFRAAGAPLSEDRVSLLNMRVASGTVDGFLCGLMAEPGDTVPIARSAATMRIVLYEGPGAVPLGDDERLALLVTLLDARYPVTRVDRDGPSDPDDASIQVIVGRFGGAALPIGGLSESGRRHLVDLGTFSQHEASGRDLLATLRQIGIHSGARVTGEWQPWFPVIDVERCSHCAQCLSFCLFSVFDQDAQGRVRVRNPASCKPNCPACARVCPEQAIIFPKCGEKSINGDDVPQARERAEPAKRNVSALLGGDLYAAQRCRSQDPRPRFSVERDALQALAERRRHLAEALHSTPCAFGAETDHQAADEGERRTHHGEDASPAATAEEWEL
ncbi:MAG: ferredoxin family protein [Planctomycetota bacterium]